MATANASPRVVLAGEKLASEVSLRRAVTLAGGVCETAHDGKECLALVRANPPDVIVIEIARSQVDCVEAIRFLRVEERSRNIPVVVVSGEEDAEARREALDAGASEFLFYPFDEAELRARVAMVMRVARLEGEVETLRRELQTARMTDGETGVLQRHYIEQRVVSEVKSARRHQHPLSLIAIKLDRPLTADHAFDFSPYACPTADAVKNLVRDEDLVARFDVDEFLVVMPHTDSYGSLILAERIRAAVETLPGVVRRITASVGVASCQRTEDFLKESPLRRAQTAMRSAVAQGGNRVVKQD